MRIDVIIIFFEMRAVFFLAGMEAHLDELVDEWCWSVT
jgi:hypothetical protein